MKVLIYNTIFTYPVENKDVVLITNEKGETIQVSMHTVNEFVEYLAQWRRISQAQAKLELIGTSLLE